MRINANTSLYGLNIFTKTSIKQEKSIEKLSSGMRINSASDDAAGLAFSKNLGTQAKSLDVSRRNILDGISLLQTAEGALTEIHSMLERVYGLSIQSKNEIHSDLEKEIFAKEAREIKNSIEEIIQKTNFNGIPLFEGESIDIRTGINVDDTITTEIDTLISKNLFKIYFYKKRALH